MTTYTQQINGDTWLVENDRDNLKISYRLKEIIAEEQSEFQHVMIVDSYDFGRTLVLDGVVQTTSADGHIYNEMITHVPLAIHPNAKKVLIIGGGDCGAAREVAKYEQIETIDQVEIDQTVVKLCLEYLPEVSGRLSDPRVHFHFTDGMKYVKEHQDEYDVIIVDSSDPVGPGEALFAKTFYQDVYQALKADGLMVCQSMSPFLNNEITAQTYGRIGEIFVHRKLYIATVPTYPGALWSFTIGSKKYHDVSIPSFEKQTKYVNYNILHNCFYLPERLQDFE
ncbi:polyamine aminopropyltransferase [Shimazuella sp. AN120528]|uniref:polyamine aminopropyltransferase n=1 Tax=Shimazuella soli TaxID=1892854 RepID=UPI001F0E4FF8|nr:polyamine aminopropyltransferase [Shimazuella soli]MCH5583801.1 polyamine aminopropyltransferase [Shimazuella soli]